MNTSRPLIDLLHRYADFIDHGNFEGVAALFRHGSVHDANGMQLAAGYDEVLAMYTGMVRIYRDTGTPKTQHLISNFLVLEESASEVRTQAGFTVMQQLASGTIETIICGQYRSVFRTVDGQWAFSQHHMHPLVIGDMSEHLLVDLGR